MNKFVVFIKRNGLKLYISELYAQAGDSNLSSKKNKAQKFHDREHIHEKLRSTSYADYRIENLGGK